MTGIQESLLDLTTNSVRVIQAVPLTLTTSGITVSIPNPLGVSGTIFGSTSDTGVGDSAGSMNAHLREMAKVLDDVWDSVNHEFRTSASVSVGSVGQGTGNAGTSPWAVSGSITIGSALPAGTNNIGKVDVNSLPALAAGTNNIGKVDINSLPSVTQGTSPWAVSGTVSVGNTPNVSVTNQPTVNQGVTSNNAFWSVSGQVSVIPTKTLVTVSFAATGTTTIVNAVASKRIKVSSVCLNCSAAQTVNWRDGSSTTLTGGQSIAANGGYALALPPPAFIFATSAGNSLDLVISGAGTCAGWITYWSDDAS